MGKISVGAAVGSGFGLIARRPVSVIVWGLVPLLLQLAAIALLAPLYLAMIAQVSAAAGGASPSTATLSPAVLQLQGMAQLLNLAQLFVSAVMYCAVFRAVLHPERSSFAYMRAGAVEFFVAVLVIGGGIALFIGILVVMIPVGIIAAVFAVAAHGSPVVFAILLPIVGLVMLIAILVVGLRFVFVGPMIVADGKFHLFESWALTRGHFGSLFLIGLSLLGVFLVFDIVLLALILALGAGAVGALGGLSQAATLFQQSPQAAFLRIWPFAAVYMVIMVPVSGCVLAIAGAPWAKAYQDLLPQPADAFA
jgi:hypothetical protein